MGMADWEKYFMDNLPFELYMTNFMKKLYEVMDKINKRLYFKRK